MPKLSYPAVFTSSLGEQNSNVEIHGVLANQEIAPKEAFLYVPNKLLISTELARQSELGPVLRNHEDVFVANKDRDYLILTLFVFYERIKG